MAVANFLSKINVFLVLIALLTVPSSDGHGRLVEPPSRASMWRFGFNNPPDYDDTAGYCGGLQKYISTGQKCGICGDPYDASRPRPHEAGGTFGRGTIVRKYSRGQVVEVKVQITANHRGFMQFKLCPTNNKKIEATEECLDSHILQMADGTGDKFHLPTFSPATFTVRMKLPNDIVCSHCVFQWNYVAGNNWGICPDGTGKLGCGPQELFRACADISIS